MSIWFWSWDAQKMYKSESVCLHDSELKGCQSINVDFYFYFLVFLLKIPKRMRTTSTNYTWRSNTKSLKEDEWQWFPATFTMLVTTERSCHLHTGPYISFVWSFQFTGTKKMSKIRLSWILHNICLGNKNMKSFYAGCWFSTLSVTYPQTQTPFTGTQEFMNFLHL
jgi:hypothetical protein